MQALFIEAAVRTAASIFKYLFLEAAVRTAASILKYLFFKNFLSIYFNYRMSNCSLFFPKQFSSGDWASSSAPASTVEKLKITLLILLSSAYQQFCTNVIPQSAIFFPIRPRNFLFLMLLINFSVWVLDLFYENIWNSCELKPLSRKFYISPPLFLLISI